jgi:2,3-bisphosphoglycerate-dependent phosphoglycerate mutase
VTETTPADDARAGLATPAGGQVPAPVGDEGPLTRLLLVRHGHARAVETGVVAGHKGCAGLSATGRAQAEALGARLVATRFRPDVLVTSVLPRATETADILARHLRLDPATTARDCDLCERHPGEADGLTWDELRSRYGPLDPVGDPDRPMSPGGESGRSFRRRAWAAVERLAADHEGRTVMAVVHGGVILAVTLRFLGLAPRSFVHDLANTSLTEWVRPASGPWLMHRFNDAAHLDGAYRPPG